MAGIMAFVIGMYSVLVWQGVPVDMLDDAFSASVPALFLCIVLLFTVYFFVVAVIAAEKALAERNWRELQQAFSYDNRGTLLNHEQPNIAFRIATFKGMLAGMVEAGVEAQTLKSALRDAGRKAAKDFAAALPSIYAQDIRTRALGGKNEWDQLDFQQKLDEWCSYDSATGWGIMSAKYDRPNESVKIDFNHMQGLFSDPDAAYFPYFLHGYCETVLSALVGDHHAGGVKGFNAARADGEPALAHQRVSLAFMLS
ncbi:MAG: hypothetical protein Tsb0016_25690 [Sphingomonadales bacterium]